MPYVGPQMTKYISSQLFVQKILPRMQIINGTGPCNLWMYLIPTISAKIFPRMQIIYDTLAQDPYLATCWSWHAQLNLLLLGFSFVVFHNKAKRTQQGNLLLPVGPDMAILNKPDRLVAQRLRPLSRCLRLLLLGAVHEWCNQFWGSRETTSI